MKVKSENLKVVENFTFEVPKTTSFINVMTALGLDKKKSLFIVGDYDKNLYLSSRNLQGVKVVNSSEISTYDIMNASEVVLSVSAVEKITAILS
jgi:large subunit ribosomal protein L4